VTEGPATGLASLHPTLAHNLVSTLGWTSLRPLQREAIEPVLRGDDALLLAPTAGGKTEAAIFPTLTRMAAERWTGLSVLYLCPLKALLNNLLPRLEVYGGWSGRRVALWHGDTPASRRKSILTDPPDLLLTTPESLESMLVSANVDHHHLFRDLRAVIVDEVHAFGAGDRGWHLLAVLERLSRVAGRPLQRIGLSATVGNPDDLLHWLQGSSAGITPATVVNPLPPMPPPAPPDDDLRQAPPAAATPSAAPGLDIQLDYVGSVANAAKVIAALHRGEKRLVFADSKRLVELLGAELRAREVTTYLVHASLSLEERRRSEEAFAAGRNCVIVSTSALELGIDVGDLDRVIQVNSPLTVAAFLQRLGRSGRRAGTVRSMLFLALDEDQFLLAAGLLLAWSQGFVEAVAPPPDPRHIVAQQLLALCLQEGRVGERLWQEWLPLPGLLGDSATEIAAYLASEGFVERDEGMLFIGPQAERRFGMRHFMGLMAVFTAPPEFTVLHGREEIGRVDPVLLVDRVVGPRLLLLAGRSWRVTWSDWKRRRCFVEPFADGGGRARWLSSGVGGLSFEIARAMRDVLLGSNPPVTLTRRADGILAGLRSDALGRVAPDRTLVSGTDDELRWWTWAGYRVNATLQATLGGVTADPTARVHDLYIRLRPDLRASTWPDVVRELSARDRLALPAVDEKALSGLKFSEALPRHLAEATLATRLADPIHAAHVLGEPVRFER
jgi:ATP-dependent helicase Lhr and Lhr-like helicase